MEKKRLFIIASFVIAVILIAVGIFLTINNEEKNIYKVSFKTNGGTIIDNQTVVEGDKVVKPTDPIKEGYIFVEWTYQGKTYDFSLEVTSDLTLNAEYMKAEDDVERFVVKFDSDGGTTISNQILEEGQKVKKPDDPTKAGYIFKGWTLDGESYDFDKIVEKDLELKAKWEKEEQPNNTTNNNSNNSNQNNNSNNNNTTPTVKKYTVTFNSKGGSAVASQTVTEGSKATIPIAPTREGYAFVEWQLNGKKYDFDSKVTKSIELIAVWKQLNKYTVTFNSDGGSSVDSQTIYEGSKATRPSNPAKNDYVFVEWQLNGKTYDFNSKVTKNIELKAVWKQVKKYTVSFNSNGGSAVASQTIIEGNKATRPSEPIKEGYNFNGWTLNGNSYDFNSSITGDITLTAKWTQKNYTVVARKADITAPFSRVLTVYEEGVEKEVKTIQYTNGVTICSGTNPNVNYYAIYEETELKLVLNSGTVVIATLTIEN